MQQQESGVTQSSMNKAVLLFATAVAGMFASGAILGFDANKNSVTGIAQKQEIHAADSVQKMIVVEKLHN